MEATMPNESGLTVEIGLVTTVYDREGIELTRIEKVLNRLCDVFAELESHPVRA
jgi:hypothetical protein